MGNLLGFIIPIALAITQPQLFGIAFKRLHQYAAATRDYAIIWNEIFQSILARTFWKLSLLAMLAELALAGLIYRAIEVSHVPWYMWALPAFLTFGQLFWALFNYASAARETSTETICGKTTTSADPVHPYWATFNGHVHPLLWLGLTSFGFLAQGGLLEYHALVNAPGYSHGEQQVIILLAFFSKVLYGVMAVATSSILGWLIVKGTRFLERTSTLIAKLIVSIDLNIEFNKNALQAIGGEIDLLDEEDVASKIKYLFTVLFTPIIILDLAIFIWPSQILAVMILFGIVATGLMEFVFGGMGPFAKQITWNERVSKIHLAFKVLPIAGMIAIALAYGMQTVTGRNIQVELENFWYGLSYIPAPPWRVSIGLALFALIAYYLLKRSFVVANEFVKGEDAKSPIISSPKSILGRYLGSWPTFLLWILSGLLAFFFFFTAFYSQFGDGAYRFSPDPHQNALALRGITVNGRALPPLQDEVWHVDAVHPHKNGKVRVEFDTLEPVTGSIEFYKPRPKLNDEENEVVELSSLPNPNNKTGLYHNFADFSVPESFSGEYRIVMDTPHVVKNVLVNGEAARATAQAIWQTPAPDKTGRVTAKFWTKEKAYGVVEFMPPGAAMKSGIYFPVSVQTTPVEHEGKVVAYQHNVDFEVPENFSGKYRLLMRNADRSPQVNHNYGRVVRTEEFDHTLPEPPGMWARFCAWWHDLWTWDESPQPPRAVVVHRYEPASRSATAPRGTGCKVKPLRVVPALRDEVASAGRR